MKEVVLYEFDNVRVEVDGLVLRPHFNLVKILKTKDVNTWINWLSRDVREYVSLHGQTYQIIYVAVWDMGHGVVDERGSNI